MRLGEDGVRELRICISILRIFRDQPTGCSFGSVTSAIIGLQRNEPLEAISGAGRDVDALLEKLPTPCDMAKLELRGGAKPESLGGGSEGRSKSERALRF